MQTFDELLFLHPASVITRLAAEPPPRQRKQSEPKREGLKQPLLLRLAAWGGARNAGVVKPAKAGLGPADPTGQAAS
jgi:hypothetical protein